MGEADWWLCTDCQSLNNLSARECYSCRKRKPKHAVRASEYLGFEAIKSWDGKITFRQLPPPEGAEATSDPVEIRPIGEPVRRDTLAVAPRPPNPARIVYQDVPAAGPAPSTPPGLPAPGVFNQGPPRPLPPQPPPPVSAVPPGGQVRVPVVPGPRGQRLVPVGPGRPPPVDAPTDAGAAVLRHEAQQRSHWQELLAVPTPNAQRLRASHPQNGAVAGRTASPRGHDQLAFHRAIHGAGFGRGGPGRGWVAWPRTDLAAKDPGPESESKKAE